MNGSPVATIDVKERGRSGYVLEVDGKLALGRHRLEVVQKTQKGERRAVASFVKVRGGDRLAERN